MPNTDEYKTKIGPTYDSIRAQLLINNQQRTWDMIQHVSTVEIASLAAWFYLYDKKEFLMSAILMVLSIIVIYCLLLAINRYVYLMNSADASLNNHLGQNIYIGKYNAKPPKYNSAFISKLIPVVILGFNFLILLFSFLKSNHYL